MHAAVEVLVCGERVYGVGLRAAGGGDGADLRARVVLVVEPLVGGLRVDIHGACAGRARRRALVGHGERAAGQVADNRGAAVDGEVAAEVQRKRADAAGKCGRGGIVRQNDVGDLLGGDSRAGDFDFVFSGRGVEKIVAKAVGGGGIRESLGERGVGINQRQRRAGLAARGHGANANRGAGEWDSPRIKYNVVFARALRVRRSDRTGPHMQRQRQQCPKKPHCNFRSYHYGL